MNDAVAATTLSAAGFTQTNIQVQGVDEGDSVETNGQYLYLLSGDTMLILDASPSTGLKTLSETSIDCTPIAEYLSGSRLTVISNLQQAAVEVTVFDVSDPRAPLIVQQTTLDGSYDSSRAIGDNGACGSKQRPERVADARVHIGLEWRRL